MQCLWMKAQYQDWIWDLGLIFLKDYGFIGELELLVSGILLGIMEIININALTGIFANVGICVFNSKSY